MRHHRQTPSRPGQSDSRSTLSFPFCPFVVCCATLVGLYYQLLVAIPGQLSRGELAGLGDGWERFFESVSVIFGSMPLVAIFVFAALLVPGFLRIERARRYYLTLSVCTLLAWVTVFCVADEPIRRAEAAVRELLSQERSFPEIIRGQ